MAKHIHAELMVQYAQDALETETPWERWEYSKSYDDKWQELVNNPHFYLDVKYRRKQETLSISINGKDYKTQKGDYLLVEVNDLGGYTITRGHSLLTPSEEGD